MTQVLQPHMAFETGPRPWSRKPDQARIAVASPVRGTYTYAIPPDLADLALPGTRVLVRFHSRKLPGYVLDTGTFSDSDAPPANLNPILDILDPYPVFPPQMIPFFEWMADHYIHPVGMVIHAALPGQQVRNASLTRKGQEALASPLFSTEETRMLAWIQDHPGKKIPWPLKQIRPLQEKGLVFLETRALKGDEGRPRLLRFVQPCPGLDLQGVLQGRGEGKEPRNEEAFLIRVFQEGSVRISDLNRAFDNGPYLVNKWVKKGALRVQEAPMHPEAPHTVLPSPDPAITLHQDQQRAVDALVAQIDQGLFSSFLLHGVTGSGKTEVYYRAIQHATGLGRQGILLTPEISLANHVQGLFSSRMGDRVALYHSNLTPAERRHQWNRMARGEVDLVIGARSALFAPLPNLGIIVVDEEHDPAYAQMDGTKGPRYHGRDAAIVRARMENALVVLGSGTPSVQAFQGTIVRKHRLLSMPQRVGKRPLPRVEVVDMKAEEERGGNGILSLPLELSLEEVLGKREQAILFLNRRGFHRVYLCYSCGRPVQCPNCDVSLTHHLDENVLSCHYCGLQRDTRVTCTYCGFPRMKAYGFGTERLEAEVHARLPHARIARMDADSTRKKGEAGRILRAFSRHEVDILLGTQMITKGYDFPGVTLVGVVAADLSLSFPDFRAGERTFQLLSQVSGRAGRGDRPGTVIVQTFNPGHYAIQTATAHDFAAFFNRESALRKQLSYPPYAHLACLKFIGKTLGGTRAGAQLCGQEIRAILEGWPKRGKEIQALGPVETPILRIKNKYRWQMLIKCRSFALLKAFLILAQSRCRDLLKRHDAYLVLDVDPYDLN